MLVVLSLSSKKADVTLDYEPFKGSYANLFSDKELQLEGNDTIELGPWGYTVLHREVS